MRFLGRTGSALFAAFILLLDLGCGTQYRPVANPVVGPGGQPQSRHYAYVVNYNPIGDGSTTQIDVSGDSVTQLQTTGLGSNYESFLSTSAAAVFVTNGGADTVSEFNVSQTGVVTTINLPIGSHPVALSSTQAGVMYVLNSQPNLACPNSGSISTISTTTLAVSNTACLFQPPPAIFCGGVNPIAMVQAPGGGRIFVINQGDNSVCVYDPSSQSIVATFTTQANKLGLNAVYLVPSADGSYIFVVTQGDKVNPPANPPALDIIATNNLFGVLPSVPLGVSPSFATLDPNLNRLYVTNSGDSTVSVLDASNVNVKASPPIPPIPSLANPPVSVGAGAVPIGVTPLANGTLFYVVNAGNNSVSVVSATSFQVLMTIALPAGSNPVWIASDPTSSKVFVANQGTSSTTIIQTVNNAIASSTQSPAQDPNCTSSCALQQPVMIITN